MYIRIAENSPESRWRQIYTTISDRILTGELTPGDELPSIRQLAVDIRVSVITVKRAYQQLEAEGYILSKQGLGTYVAELKQELLHRTRVKQWRDDLLRLLDEGVRLGVDDNEIKKLLQIRLERRT